MYVSYALSGVALLGAMVWAVVDDRQSEWRAHQEEHAALVAQVTPAGSPVPSVRVELRQVFLPELGVADRCKSCHLGIDNPDMVGQAEPHRVHPGDLLDAHPPERFGCTPCHGGDGRGIGHASASHAPGPRSIEPMVPPREREARCGVCHQEPVVGGAPELSEGRRLLGVAGCAACHEIPGVLQERPFGPALDGVGTKLARATLVTWLKDPAAVRPETRMPTFRLTDAQVEGLADFLSAQRLADPPQDDPAADGDPEAGRALFGQARCTTCHAVKGRGGVTGPPLDRLGDRVTPAWLLAWLRDPHRIDPDTAMPAVGFDAQQSRDLAAWLLEELVSDDSDGAVAVVDAPPPPERVEAGRLLFEELGCAACHVVRGADRERQFAPTLQNFGAAPLEKLSFAALPEGTRRTLSDWIYRKIERPELHVPVAKMPKARLTAEQIAQATLAVLSLREVPWPEVRPWQPPAPFRPPGEIGALVRRYRCLSCHRIGGDGGDVSGAPLDREGSKVEAAWLEAFLLAPDTIRVAQQERMPNLRLSQGEAKTLAAWLVMVMRDDAIPLEVPAEIAAGASARRGAELVESLGCRGCHPIDGKGGYVGPDLVRTGARLRSGWVYALLRTPALLRPEVLHPDWGLSEVDAASLVAHLKSLAPVAPADLAPAPDPVDPAEQEEQP